MLHMQDEKKALAAAKKSLQEKIMRKKARAEANIKTSMSSRNGNASTTQSHDKIARKLQRVKEAVLSWLN
jgi:hypothetical protein